MIKVMTVKDQDLLALAEYAKDCSWRAGKSLANKINRGFYNDEARFICKYSEGKIIAFCALVNDDCIPNVTYKPYISFVFVEESWRGKRLSEVLIETACHEAKAMNYDKVYLVSNEVGLYEKYGFELYRHHMDYWGEETGLYKKSLDNV